MRPLRAPGFPRLLVSLIVNYIGNFAAVVALALVVYDQTGDPLATAGLFVAAELLPAFLAPVLTARVDRRPAASTLALLHALEALLFVALAALTESFSLVLIYVAVFADGVLMLTARSLTRAAVNATLVREELLREGNGLLNLGFAVSGVVGSALGGVLVGAVGAGAVLLGDAATFLVIAVILGTARGLVVSSEDAEEDGLSTRARLAAGLRHAAGEPKLRALLVGETAAIFFFALIVPIEVVYAKDTLDSTDAGYGALLASWSVGIVIGSLLFITARRASSIAMLLIASTAIGVAYLGMAGTSTLVIACAWSVLGGMGNGVQWVAAMTLIQSIVAQHLQARIVSLLESGASAATGLGFLAGGVVTAVLSAPAAFAVSGIGILVLVAGGLVTLGLTPRRERRAQSDVA